MMRPLCSLCNQLPRAINLHRGDKTYYRSRCESCIRKGKKLTRQKPLWEIAGYKKKPVCDFCGFRSRYSSQVLVYHCDGNLKNTSSRNLKTICRNCVEVIKKDDPVGKVGDLEPDF